MKTVLLAVLLAVIVLAPISVFPVEQKPTDSPKSEVAKQTSSANAKDSAGSKQEQSTSPVTVIVKQENTPSHHPDETKDDENVRIQRKLANFTAWLVVVGFIQAAILAFTVWAIFHQSNVAKNTERAWILVNRVGNPETWYDLSKPFYTPGMIFEFKIYGRTPATLVKTIFHLENVSVKAGTQPPEPELPAIPQYKSPGPTTEVPDEGRILPPDGIFQISLWFNQNLTEEQWIKLKDGQTVMCAYGIVRYKDAFGRKKETRVCYVYRFAWGGVITAPDGTILNPPGFRIGGPKGYNLAT